MSGAVLLALLPIAAVNLYLLWWLIVRQDAQITASVLAGWLILALASKAMRPEQALVPVWLPFLYPYVWLGLAAVLWMLMAGRQSGGRVAARFAPAAHDGLQAVMVAALLLHASLAMALLVASPLARLYVFSPSLLCLLLLACTFIVRLYQLRRGPRPLGGLFVLVVCAGLPALVVGAARWLQAAG